MWLPRIRNSGSPCLDATSDLSNVASYSCKEQEGAFLAGALAALAKQEKTDRQ